MQSYLTNRLINIDLPFPLQDPVFQTAGALAELTRTLKSTGSFWKPRCVPPHSLADTNLSTPAKSELSLRGKFTAYFMWNLLPMQFPLEIWPIVHNQYFHKRIPVQLSHLCVENLPVILIRELIMIIYCSHSQSLQNVKLSGNLPISHSMPNFVALFILFLLHRKYTQDILHFKVLDYWSIMIETHWRRSTM